MWDWSRVCPECGRSLVWKDFQDDRQMPGGWFVVLTILGAAMWLAVGLLGFFPSLMFQRVFGAAGPLLPLADVTAIIASSVLILKWGARPRRLLAYPPGLRIGVQVVFVPMGVAAILAGPVMAVVFVWMIVA